MSLPSTVTARAQLTAALGDRESHYWSTFREFLLGQISRAEFDEQVRESLNTPQLVLLHNALIISLFDTSRKAVLPAPPVEVKPPKPPRKRKRQLPYQGPDGGDEETLTSARLKKWVVGSGKRERERIRGLEAVATTKGDMTRARPERDEIAREPGVMLLPERGEPPGSRLPLHLAQVTRAPTLQHVADRINLISAQHNLSAPSKTVSQLLMLAFEAKLKQLISRTISLTATSRAIASIQPTQSHSHGGVLSPISFQTLFAISPAMLPYQSAAAMRLALSAPDVAEESTAPSGGDGDTKTKMLSVLAERSAIRDALMSAR